LKKTDDTFIKDSVPTEKISNTMMNNSEATVNSETTDISLDTPKGKKGKHTSSTQCNLGLAALFEKLENLMNEKQIYKDKNLNRESIMQFLNVNRNQLAQMMAENTNGLSISSYINEYRIQNACDMIRNNHNVSMQEVCIECGFSLFVHLTDYSNSNCQ
jgi:AraC-type DNA-binding domain-containing proteins